MTAVVWRDALLAVRSGGGFALALAFFLVLCVFVPLGVGADRAVLSQIAPGILWIGALLSCLLSLDRMFQLDAEDGALDAMATLSLPLEALAAAKATAHWLTTGLPLTVLSPVLGFLLGLPLVAYPWLVASLGVGTLALSFIGCFGAAITVGVRRGGLLLSLLVLPLYIPTLIFGAQTVIRPTQDLGPVPTLALLTALTLACVAAMPFASAAALRASLR